MDRDSGRSKGFAFLEVRMSEQTIRLLDGTQLLGRTVTVNLARPRDDRPIRRQSSHTAGRIAEQESTEEKSELPIDHGSTRNPTSDIITDSGRRTKLTGFSAGLELARHEQDGGHPAT